MGREDHRIMPDPDDDRIVDTLEGVRVVLGRITFARSCVDMAWTWEVRQSFNPMNSIPGGPVNGARIFDPHNTVQELGYIQGNRYTRSIP